MHEVQEQLTNLQVPHLRLASSPDVIQFYSNCFTH
ncbi:hypothetical protein T05_2932 [Trichinella murrelli]|uniref:Uncharacterized protein n=1 Tax=Trichinella murrelli TaxID=144512 RepID=A0A0V0STW4_9BILA|nr:hypothetical protein T05_2932 [Trichinella murrelli]